MKRHIAILDPAAKIAETDCYNHLTLLSELPTTYHLPKLGGMDSLNNLAEGLAGIVILGSSSSVNDCEPWQEAMNDWLLPRLQDGIPTLGFCYGHQLIAYLFGGKVGFYTPDKQKQIGFRKVSFKANYLWGGKPMEGVVAVTHREVVQTCPKEFEVVGESPEVPIDAIAHKMLPIWSMQSHPESTKSFLVRYGIPPEGSSEKLKFGQGIVKKFFEFCANSG